MVVRRRTTQRRDGLGRLAGVFEIARGDIRFGVHEFLLTQRLPEAGLLLEPEKLGAPAKAYPQCCGRGSRGAARFHRASLPFASPSNCAFEDPCPKQYCAAPLRSLRGL